MKVVFISPWYSEGMGYSENMFPKALSKLDVDVHLVTSTAQINYYSPNYDKTYKSFLGPKFVDSGVTQIDGFTLHRLPYFETKKMHEGPGIIGLYDYLEKLQPDIIQALEIKLDTTYVAARYAHDKDCLFFTECHIHASVFRESIKRGWMEYLKNLRNVFNPKLIFINKISKICYPIAEDVAEIAIAHYRVPERKIKIQSLGVDTYAFHPPTTPDQLSVRDKVRKDFKFAATDIVCIYTGRFTEDKNPHCLAKAIDELNKTGLPFKGLFVGNGPEKDINFILSMMGCLVAPFVPAKELPYYYWAADIGIWPREESTSQLDAAACGLPLILSNRIKVLERIEGNGLLYKEGDHTDLAATIKQMTDPSIREKMSIMGIQKIREKYSWELIAKERMKDYRSFLEK